MSGPFRDFRSARTDVERELDSWLTRIENTRSIGTSCAATTTDDPWRSRPRTAATGSAATSRRPVVHPSQFDAQFCSARFICAEDEPGLPELLGQLAPPTSLPHVRSRSDIAAGLKLGLFLIRRGRIVRVTVSTRSCSWTCRCSVARPG